LARASHDRGNQYQAVSNDVTQPSEYASALERTGISRQTAHRYQELAGVPRETFEAHLNGADRPTTSAIINAARDPAPKIDDRVLWLWGRARDFERDGYAEWRCSRPDSRDDRNDARRRTPHRSEHGRHDLAALLGARKRRG